MTRWSILIPTLSARRDKLLGLLDVLLPQVDAAAGLVEVVACSNNGSPSLGEIRQALMHEGHGDYLSFVDDDDMVATDFVSAVLEAMRSDPDVVQFQNTYFVAGEFRSNCHVSLALQPADYGQVLHRDITHVQPIKAELAKRGDFRVAWPEDSSWRAGVRPHLRTEVVIDRPLYRYRHDPADSVQYRSCWPELPRPVVVAPHFRWMEP